MTDPKKIDLYTTADLCESEGKPLRTILSHVHSGRLPPPSINFPSGRGLFVWTEGQLRAAGFKVPKKASLALNLS